MGDAFVKMLLIYHLYRIFTMKCVVVFIVLLLLNMGMYIAFTYHTEPWINRFLQREVYGTLYWAESFFILKMTMIISILLLTETLFEHQNHDTAMLMRFHPLTVFVSKLCLIAVIFMLKTLFLFVLIYFIYAKTPFSLSLRVDTTVIFTLWLSGLRTLALMVLIMVLTRHKAWLLLLFLAYILMEISYTQQTYIHSISTAQKTLALIFSNVFLSPQEGFVMLNHKSLNLFISGILLIVAHGIERIEGHK